MMHIVKMIERRHPEHADGITRGLMIASLFTLMAGGLLLLSR